MLALDSFDPLTTRLTMPYAVWHGTADELERLQKATQIHCNCERNARGAWVNQCGGHRLLGQQRLLDRLLFVRRMRDQFITREFVADQDNSVIH
jgi:hypothetical protein